MCAGSRAETRTAEGAGNRRREDYGAPPVWSTTRRDHQPRMPRPRGRTRSRRGPLYAAPLPVRPLGHGPGRSHACSDRPSSRGERRPAAAGAAPRPPGSGRRWEARGSRCSSQASVRRCNRIPGRDGLRDVGIREVAKETDLSQPSFEALHVAPKRRQSLMLATLKPSPGGKRSM